MWTVDQWRLYAPLTRQVRPHRPRSIAAVSIDTCNRYLYFASAIGTIIPVKHYRNKRIVEQMKRTFPGFSGGRRAGCALPPKRRTKMGSTSDKISGKANELTGKAKQAVGDATDNHSMEAKGAAQEAKGHGQQAKGEAKDAVKNVVDKA
jgi:uncharacterized protein YjbJ (UPF0337 family)